MRVYVLAYGWWQWDGYRSPTWTEDISEEEGYWTDRKKAQERVDQLNHVNTQMYNDYLLREEKDYQTKLDFAIEYGKDLEVLQAVGRAQSRGVEMPTKYEPYTFEKWMRVNEVGYHKVIELEENTTKA